MWNNSFNLVVIEWFNQYALASVNVNRVVNYIQGAYLFKGFPAMGLLWFFWFRDTDKNSRTRRIIIGTFIGCLLAVFLAIVINNIVPHQPRPFENGALNFQAPVGVTRTEGPMGRHWNSFPSHHASMFFSIAMGVFLISRKAGYLAFLYVILFIAAPRIYLGLHYPTDIISGAILGMTLTALVNQEGVRKLYEGQCMRLLDRYPAAFQAALLMLTFEMAVIFDDVLVLAGGIVNYFFKT